MNIGIDARLLERRMTGIGRSLKILLDEIPKYESENTYFLFSYGPVPHDAKFYTQVTTGRCPIPQKLFSPIWSTFVLPWYLKKYHIDVLFSINQIVPLIKINNCKYISVLNDVIYHKDRKYLPFIYRAYLQVLSHFSVKISDVIITISEYSKKDIIEQYHLPPDRVKVVYPSANAEFKPIVYTETERNEIKSSFHLSPHIVLYVGVIENRKNILGILKIADELYGTNKEIGFLLVGKLGHGSGKIVSEIHKRKNVVHLANIDDGILKKLFNISDVFLFPSFYEGFGYPPLEAMQCGLPVITSNTTSLKEVVGDGGVQRDPHEYKQMSDDILKLLADEEHYERMRARGLAQSKIFTIQNYVTGMLEVFHSFKN